MKSLDPVSQGIEETLRHYRIRMEQAVARRREIEDSKGRSLGFEFRKAKHILNQLSQGFIQLSFSAARRLTHQEQEKLVKELRLEEEIYAVMFAGLCRKDMDDRSFNFVTGFNSYTAYAAKYKTAEEQAEAFLKTNCDEGRGSRRDCAVANKTLWVEKFVRLRLEAEKISNQPALKAA